MTKKRVGAGSKDSKPVPTIDTSFERVKLSESTTKKRSQKPESPFQPKAKPKRSVVSALDSQQPMQGSNPAPSGSTAPLKPKQMSIMAFVQKKKEEALEKRVSGYLSPASEAS
jgi:hypothetical protein